MEEMTELCWLGRKYGTDKGGWHLKAGDTCHNYLPTYHRLLGERREQVESVLEIGIGGGSSLKMWEEYFPQAQIVGLDHDRSKLINEGRIKSLFADQASEESMGMALLAAGIRHYDLIVDDGSHEAEHQVCTANWLFPFLAEDGLYVIEDIHYDCKPELYLDQIKRGTWLAHPTGIGLGRARCECGCGKGEVLLVGSL